MQFDDRVACIFLRLVSHHGRLTAWYLRKHRLKTVNYQIAEAAENRLNIRLRHILWYIVNHDSSRMGSTPDRIRTSAASAGYA